MGIAEGSAFLLDLYYNAYITKSSEEVGGIVANTVVIKLNTDGSKTKIVNLVFYVDQSNDDLLKTVSTTTTTVIAMTARTMTIATISK